MSDYCCCVKSLKRLAIVVPGAIRASLVGATSVSSTGLRRLLKQKRPLLSLRRLCLCRIHHDLDCPFHVKHIQSPRGGPSFVYRLLSLSLSRWHSNFGPFFLLSYRCLSFPRPPSVTRASRFILANKRPSRARPRPEQDFYSLSRATLHRISYKPATAGHVACINPPLSFPSTPDLCLTRLLQTKAAFFELASHLHMPHSSLGSPSLQKMEASRRDMYAARKPRFSCGQIIGDPFALATSSIAIVCRRRTLAPLRQTQITDSVQIAWLIAFVASVISKIHGQFPNYSWWALVYMFFCIIGVLVTVASDSVFTYHVAVSNPLRSRARRLPC